MRIALVLGFLLAFSARRQEPALSEERVVLHTSMGDLHLALYPDVAPRHFSHFLRLVRNGVYDGSHFDFVKPGFLIRNAGDYGRPGALTADQARLVQVRVPGEFSSQRHVRGALSMVRDPEDIDSARTSFTILLADAPQLDGKYTIFGRVDAGLDVLESLAGVECDAEGRPRQRVEVVRAEIVGKAGGDGSIGIPAPLIPVAAVSIGIGLAAFLLAGKILPRPAGPLGLVLVFFGFLLGFIAAGLASPAVRSGGIALAVFIGALAFFKLMNRFEGPR
jgi:peptidyl-prolyl cis-trans isomerase B (cyclophilin B)